MSQVRTIRAKAPLRISFSGGGTDVPPYPADYGGVALNATINRYAYCTVELRPGDSIELHSVDLDQTATFKLASTPIFDGNLDLVKAVLRRIDPDRLLGLTMSLQSDAPPGSGLGSSSALVVAVLVALSRVLGLYLTPHELAHLAYVIERTDMRILGGSQDQYAVAYGGFNFMEFREGAVDVYPLRLRRELIEELELHLMLCFTGTTRLSAGILEKQVARYTSGQPTSATALHRIKALTYDLQKELLAGRLMNFGALLDDAWTEKKRLTPEITSGHIDELYQAAKRAGAIGGKLLGAGGGGYLLLFVPPALKPKIGQVLEEAGGRVTPFINFSESGPYAWEVRENASAISAEFRHG
jgi:D-glycero-alpha-D-manno-heptose-7-phosphate kinase